MRYLCLVAILTVLVAMAATGGQLVWGDAFASADQIVWGD